MHSVKIKLFLGISLFVVFFIVLSWFLNIGFLEKYYIWQKKNVLIRYGTNIDSMYKGNIQDILFELEMLESTKGIHIAIFGEKFIPKYNSYLGPGNLAIRKRKFLESDLLNSIRVKKLLEGKYIIFTVYDPELKTYFLNYVNQLKSKEFLVLSTPIAAINESVRIANKFLLLTGIITIVLSTIVVFVFSKKFTRPILELNDIAQRMSKLDFSKKYLVKSKDEIGQLGLSINSLSGQLDKSISELKNANKKLMEDIEKERKLDEMRKEFVSSVSHELKTPVALIQGYAEGLKENIAQDEESKDFYCDVIMDEANKMDKLIKDLLDLSRIDSGYFNLEREDFQLHSLIKRTIDKFSRVFKDKGINISVDIHEDISVNGDIVRIEQVLVNYLNNAITHLNDKKIIKVSTAMNDEKVRVSVYNSGKPIPEESIDKVWLSFYKDDKARTRAHGGTGLGLAIVRGIMKLHHNEYGVINHVDGVEFWFELNKNLIFILPTVE